MALTWSPGIWIDRSRIQCPPDVNIIADICCPIDKLPSERIWFIQIEPEAIIPTQDYLCTNWNRFERIYTYNQIVLDTCPNAYKYLYGTSWIDISVWLNINIYKKQFAVSSITGGKADTVGQRFRLKLFKFQDKCPISSVWFQSKNANLDFLNPNKLSVQRKIKNPRLGESKVPLFEKFQFSFVIENSRQQNYFTEKLIDCLITKTIPIYYGCPNIGDFFDIRGWIILENDSVEEAFAKIQQLVQGWYPTCIPVIEDNCERAKKYVDLYANINLAIEQSH
jgi:hypothetical protein